MSRTSTLDSASVRSPSPYGLFSDYEVSTTATEKPALKLVPASGSLGVGTERPRRATYEPAQDPARIAEQELQKAIRKFRRPGGWEGDLVEAADLMKGFGKAAWPALRVVARERTSECEFFVDTIVSFRELAGAEWAGALLDLAHNPSPNTRSRLLEALDELPPRTRSYILDELASLARPDDDVTDRARSLRDSVR